MTARNEENKKSFIQKMFHTKLNNGGDGWKVNKDSISSFDIDLSYGEEEEFFDAQHKIKPNSVEQPIMQINQDVQSLLVFAATWNVGGKSPNNGLSLDDLLQVHNESDIYVLGFQEIVPLNAGNVLVIEDNGSAAKWLSLISQSLNKCSNNTNMKRTNTTNYETKPSAVFGSIKPPITTHSNSDSSPFYQRTSLKAASRVFRSESRRKLKSCNCASDGDKKYISKDSCFACQKATVFEDESSSEEEDASNSSVTAAPEFSVLAPASGEKQMKYSLVKSKQMVGIFVTIWVRKELVQYISHLRTSCISRGILGYLGNKGCISVSMSFKQTSFCFVCSHLASGEKEGDELRRNSDVIEILKSTQFPKICKTNNSRMPEKILDHDRVLWLGDLNYRIALSYNDARKFLEQNDWDALLNKDQLKIERESGRVFKGWKEGKIFFAPTYKYSYNSDTYAGETIKSKSKRRTPAWCDRILWYGDGIQQKSYIRWESRFSDHRPVCATFLVDLFIC